MKDIIKANLKVLPVTLLLCIMSVYAAGEINPSAIAYDGTKVANVKAALDTLYDSIDVATITPVGAILPYMGTQAPENYLICDGSTYNIADYQKLANHIKNNFGSYNFFGGDGETTFAVPDLRGEFLRGTGTNSHTNTFLNQAEGSGANVGVHQSATAILETNAENHTGKLYVPYLYSDNLSMHYADSRSLSQQTGTAFQSVSSLNNENKWAGIITTRPTNTSVNYIIKVK